jgi:hypothetical protein
MQANHSEGAHGRSEPTSRNRRIESLGEARSQSVFQTHATSVRYFVLAEGVKSNSVVPCNVRTCRSF